jgi:hypothetical protein
MKKRSLPQWFGASALVIAAVYGLFNIAAWLDDKVANTISAAITTLFDANLAVPLFVAICLGHWCSRDLDLPKPGVIGFAIMASLVLVAGVVDWLLGGWIARRYPSIIIVLAGLSVGCVTWVMSKEAPA